jgi:hypothetical protein
VYSVNQFKHLITACVKLLQDVDMAHTVSINGIFTLIQYNGEIDQVSAVSTYFSRLFKSSALNNKNLDFGAKLL